MVQTSGYEGTLRIGVLGAARIVKGALVAPAQRIPDVRVAAIASRTAERAQAHADKHSIPRAYGSYRGLLDDPSVDAVYIPLPAAMHAGWMIAAMDAGKHVLCEKPFTSNAQAAERVAARASASSVVVMEGYHTHYHPLHGRLRQIVASGELGTVTGATATFCAPIPPGKDIRWQRELGGGSLLDIGYYPVRALREVLGEISNVEEARAWQRNGVDRLLTATLRLENGVQGRVVSSMWSRRLLDMRLEITGTRGRLRATRPYHPQLPASKIVIRTVHGRRVETTSRRPTYTAQLEAFRDAVRNVTAVPTGAHEAVLQLRALDAIYFAAGVAPRP